MENLIQISKLNDFIFCPYSIYLHSIYENFSDCLFRSSKQTTGKIRHLNIDYKKYSKSKNFLQGITVYSQKYKLIGKIDIYDKKNKTLIERKYQIKKIYDGYRYQLYAQYFCLLEQGYEVKKLFLHSLIDNKRYSINLPSEKERKRFKNLIKKIYQFDVLKKHQAVSIEKCNNCIYKTLCDNVKPT